MWRFSLKEHIGVGSKQGVVHSVCMTVASVLTQTCCPLLHGEERSRSGGGGYQEQSEAIIEAAPNSQEPILF